MKAHFDRLCITLFRGRGIAILRLCLGLVFLWFGLLKVLGVSPVAYIIALTYDFLPVATPNLLILIGILEILIGLGLVFKISLRVTLTLLWLQMGGIFAAVLFDPQLFFSGWNVLLLTLEGEFVAKNMVLVAASLVIAEHEIDYHA